VDEHPVELLVVQPSALSVRSQFRSVFGDTPRNAAASFTVM